jgi:alpha-L-fucosidase
VGERNALGSFLFPARHAMLLHLTMKHPWSVLFRPLNQPASAVRAGLFAAILSASGAVPLTAAEPAAAAPLPATDLQWFKDAKLGIFIHWGIYSEGKSSESWAFHDGKLSYEEYYAQAKTFTAANYHPEAWARLFKAAGARYVVLTSKHHDGFALWDTKLSPFNAKESSPAGRDLIGPYCEALRHEGLKVGLYFSHLDWHHPDYASILPPHAKERPADPQFKNIYGYPQGAERPEAWKRFLAFHRGQLAELSQRFHPDLLWFDGDWERSAEQWGFKELRAQLKAANPKVILNARLGGYGDYDTPEQYLPLEAPNGPWELCMTINDSWGYQKNDHHYKSVRQVVRLLAECAGMGGNLLLDVGPLSDGSLQPEQVAVLEGLGQWTHRNAEALYGTGAGLPPGYFLGSSTLSPARDILYLFFFDQPIDAVPLRGIRNHIKHVSVLGGPELTFDLVGGAPWLNMPGIAWIKVPASAVDRNATVIKVELDGPLDLAAKPKASAP